LDSKQSSCSQAAQSSGLGCGVVNTTATSAAAGGVDQLDQELAAPSRQTQTQHTQEHTVLPQFHSSTNIFESISNHHGVQLKLKTKPRRRRTRDQQQVQEEKDKPGAEPGGEGKLEAAITISKQTQQRTTLSLHNFSHQVEMTISQHHIIRA
jgi:hypothetical protein